jgi:hypothetical protein
LSAHTVIVEYAGLFATAVLLATAVVLLFILSVALSHSELADLSERTTEEVAQQMNVRPQAPLLTRNFGRSTYARAAFPVAASRPCQCL